LPSVLNLGLGLLPTVTGLSFDRLKLKLGAFNFAFGGRTGFLSDINNRPCYLSIIYLHAK
jgi:hypothetical protein